MSKGRALGLSTTYGRKGVNVAPTGTFLPGGQQTAELACRAGYREPRRPLLSESGSIWRIGQPARSTSMPASARRAIATASHHPSAVDHRRYAAPTEGWNGLRSEEDGEPGADWREEVRSRGVIQTSRGRAQARLGHISTRVPRQDQQVTAIARELSATGPAFCRLAGRPHIRDRHEGSTAPSVVGVCWTRDRRAFTEAGRKERL